MERRPLIFPTELGSAKITRTGGRNSQVALDSDVYGDESVYLYDPGEHTEEPEEGPLTGLGKFGKPLLYRVSYNKLVRNMRMLGFTVREVAATLGVSEPTILHWRHTYPAFQQAWTEGGIGADGKVARAMFKRAVGYKHPAVRIFNNEGRPLYADFTQHYPPDTAAGSFWLTNRQREYWRQGSTLALTGPNGKELKTTPPSLNVMVVQYERRKTGTTIDQQGADASGV